MKLTLVLIALQMRNDHYYMEICLALSKQAAEKVNTAVRAVVVKDDEIVSEAEETVITKMILPVMQN